MVEILSAQRKQVDTLRDQEWSEFLMLDTAEQKVVWLQHHSMQWHRKNGETVRTTETFRQLPQIFQAAGCLSIGAKGIPICVVPSQTRTLLTQKIQDLYPKPMSPEFLNWLSISNRPLIAIWITGFKPGGEDSRPDRGLAPLVRMLFGDEVDVLSIISGPAKPQMWRALQNSPQQQAKDNGLWESIVNLSDAILVDSITSTDGTFALTLPHSVSSSHQIVHFPAATTFTTFSEHDVDSILHTLFSRQLEAGVFEAMCNPPGGDWSGLSLLDFSTNQEFRWTSLPRVSGSDKKRPDHVIEFLVGNDILILSIESKNLAKDIEPNIGARLNIYTEQLLKAPPITAKTIQNDWNLGSVRSLPLTNFRFVSGGAFCWTKENALKQAFIKAAVDIVFGVEIHPTDNTIVLHIIASQSTQFLLDKLSEIIENFGGQVKIQIH
jgi:hypothetical protein